MLNTRKINQQLHVSLSMFNYVILRRHFTKVKVDPSLVGFLN